MSFHLDSRGRLIAGLATLALTPGGVAGLPAAASASPLGVAPMLGGITSQGLPVVVLPAPSGRRLKRINLVLRMKCTSGVEFLTPDYADGLSVAADGRVAGMGVIPPSPPLVSGLDTLVGHFDRVHDRFAGTWRLRLVFSQSGTNDRCDSGPVEVHARL